MNTRNNGGRKPLTALERRTLPNPRYAHIKSRLDTGLTVDKVKFVTTREYLRYRDESFFRVTGSQLADLLSEYEQDLNEGLQDIALKETKTCDGPMVATHSEESIPDYDRPYLMLDLREPSEFKKFRILQSRNFPAVLFNQDRMTSEILKFKNKKGALVILYADEERISCQVAHTLVHRGFDNVYVLTGGLLSFCEHHPYYVEGLPHKPSSAKDISKLSTARRVSTVGTTFARTTAGRPTSASSTGLQNSGRSQLGSLQVPDRVPWGPSREMRATRAPFRGENVSVKSTMSVADSVISKAAARKSRLV